SRELTGGSDATGASAMCEPTRTSRRRASPGGLKMRVRRYRLSAICQPSDSWPLAILETFQTVREIGGEGQNRTVDTTIFSRMLYQLSYLATRGTCGSGKTKNHSMASRSG